MCVKVCFPWFRPRLVDSLFACCEILVFLCSTVRTFFYKITHLMKSRQKPSSTPGYWNVTWVNRNPLPKVSTLYVEYSVIYWPISSLIIFHCGFCSTTDHIIFRCGFGSTKEKVTKALTVQKTWMEYNIQPFNPCCPASYALADYFPKITRGRFSSQFRK